MGCPVNNMVSDLADHRVLLAFADEPAHARFWVATPAALVALKVMAFGRTRHSGEPVDRDFSDVALLLDRLGGEIAAEAERSSTIRARVIQAARRLADDDAAIAAASRELVLSGQHSSERAAALVVRRAARRLLRQLCAETTTASPRAVAARRHPHAARNRLDLNPKVESVPKPLRTAQIRVM